MVDREGLLVVGEEDDGLILHVFEYLAGADEGAVAEDLGELLVVDNGKVLPERFGAGEALVELVHQHLEILHPDVGVRGEDLEDAGLLVAGELGVDVRDDADVLDVFDRELLQRIEGADGLDLVVEQLDPVGIFVAVAEDVDDSAADGKLSGLINEILALEAVLDQNLDDGIDVEQFALGQFDPGGGQFGGRDHLFEQGFGVSHDDLAL